jgi:hypothetical protein
MRRHLQAKLITDRIMANLARRGWSEANRRVVTMEGMLDSPTLNQDFQNTAMRNNLLLSTSTTVDDVHWSFSITFAARTVNGRTVWSEGLDAFRVLSYCSIADPSKTGCEFVIHDRKWEKLGASEDDFLRQLNERLDEEVLIASVRWDRKALRKMRLNEWQVMLGDRGVPPMDYANLDQLQTWDLLEGILIKEGRLPPLPPVTSDRAQIRQSRLEDWQKMLHEKGVPLAFFAHLDAWKTWELLEDILAGELIVKETQASRGRARSPKRAPAIIEPVITSIFWMEWGKNDELFAARMAKPHEISPPSHETHVYFFGSHTICPYQASKKHAWESHQTKSVRHKKAVEEALAYAVVN